MGKKKRFHSAGMSDYQIDNVDENVFRDKRNGIQKIGDFIRGENISFALLVAGFIIMVTFSASAFIPAITNMVHSGSATYIFFDLFFVTVMLYLVKRTAANKPKYPFLAPAWDDPDYDKKTADKRGWFILGNSIKTGFVAAVSKADLLTHILMFGTTGSGKSETLFTFSMNCILQGSGVLFTDGKADSSLVVALYTIARRVGRDMDMLVISYIKGSEDSRETRTPIRKSNTINPMANGGHSTASELTISLMTSSEGDNAIFSKRAEAFVKAYMPLMTYLRDTGRRMPYVKEFATEMSSLTMLVKLASDTTIPISARKPLQNYLIGTHDSLAQALKSPGVQIAPDAHKQHGFISMQLAEPLQLLGDEYGAIFNVQYSDIETADVLVNRRILITLIPSLEKSEGSLQSLGKVVIASLKILLAQIMGGSHLSGSVNDILGKRATRAVAPYIGILDEAGYYMSTGVAVIPAQARSIGMGFVFAGQDKPALDKLVDTETDSIIGNTTIKACGRVEEIEKTGDVFVKRASKAYISQTQGAGNQDSMAGNMVDQGQLSVNEVDRLSVRDIIDQDTGEFLFMRKDAFDFVKVLYAFEGVKKVQDIQIHDFLPTPPFSEIDVQNMIEKHLLEKVRMSSFIRSGNGPNTSKDEPSVVILPEKDGDTLMDRDIIIYLLSSVKIIHQRHDGSKGAFDNFSKVPGFSPPGKDREKFSRGSSRPGAKERLMKNTSEKQKSRMKNEEKDTTINMKHDDDDIMDLIEIQNHPDTLNNDFDALSKASGFITGDSIEDSSNAMKEIGRDIKSAIDYPRNASAMEDKDNHDEFLTKLMAQVEKKVEDTDGDDSSGKDERDDFTDYDDEEIL